MLIWVKTAQSHRTALFWYWLEELYRKEHVEQFSWRQLWLSIKQSVHCLHLPTYPHSSCICSLLVHSISLCPHYCREGVRKIKPGTWRDSREVDKDKIWWPGNIYLTVTRFVRERRSWPHKTDRQSDLNLVFSPSQAVEHWNYTCHCNAQNDSQGKPIMSVWILFRFDQHSFNHFFNFMYLFVCFRLCLMMHIIL